MKPNYLWIVLLTASFVIPTAMLANCARRRSHFALRATLSLLALLLVFGIVDTTNMIYPRPTVSDLTTYVPCIAGFGLGIVALIAASYLCFDISIWVASFCGTAGYICQNTGSSLGVILTTALPRLTMLPDVLRQHNALFSSVGATMVYVAAYYLMARPVRTHGLTEVDNHHTLLMTFVAIFVNIVAALSLGDLAMLGMATGGILILQTLHLTTCVLMLCLEYELLYRRQMLREVETTQRVLEERARQYELSRENIEAINVKCHDIRHQIRHLRGEVAEAVDSEVLASIASEVDIYDSMVKTGNDALDTILNEKSLLCERESISLSCIVDGEVLGFMAPADIYAFFGNALDNAIEAERQVQNHNNRSISLIVRNNAGLATVHVENYYTGEATFVDGLPQTTKEDGINHGFGTRSMRLIVERYGGTLSLGTEESTFYVNAIIPAA